MNAAFWIMLLGEMALLFAAISVGLVLYGLRQRRNDRAAAERLIGRIRAGEDARRERVAQALGSHFQLQGESLEQVRHDLLHNEKLLYQKLANGYATRDELTLAEIEIDVENLSGVLLALELPHSEPVAADPVEDLNPELERLRHENEQMADELRVTMETMGRMLDEYANMFGGGDPDAVDKSAMLNHFRRGGDDDESRPVVAGVTAEAAKAEPPAVDEPTAGDASASEQEPPEADDWGDLDDVLSSFELEDDPVEGSSEKPQR